MSKVTKKKTSTDKQIKAEMKKLKNKKYKPLGSTDGPWEVRTAVTKLSKCKKNCDKQKKNLRTTWSRKCYNNDDTKKTPACTEAAEALGKKKGSEKYKFHPVYGNLRY